MADLEFEILLNAAATSKDRAAFVEEWIGSHIFKEKNLNQDIANPIIKNYLEQLWDAAHMTVRDIHRKSGLTQQEMSVMLGVHIRRIADWCSGDHAPPTHVRLMMLRLLQMVPPYHKLMYALCYLSDNTPKRRSSPPTKMTIKREGRIIMQNRYFEIKQATYWETTASVADLIAAGAPIDTALIEEAGLDVKTMNPLYFLAKIEDAQDPDRANISFYYGFKGYGELHSAFGIPLSCEEDPSKSLMKWLPAIVDGYIDWETLASEC